MSFDKYDKDTQDKVIHSPQLEAAIVQMYKNGYDKDRCVKITGAPYEVVDSHYKRLEKINRNRPEYPGPRPDEED